MNKLQYDTDKYILYDRNPLEGRIVDMKKVNEEISFLDEEIATLEGILNDSKKLLAWAKEEFPARSGLLELQDRREKLGVDKTAITEVQEVNLKEVIK